MRRKRKHKTGDGEGGHVMIKSFAEKHAMRKLGS